MSILTAQDWIYDTLKGDVTLMGMISDVYVDLAPDTKDKAATYPFVILRRMSDRAVLGVGSILIMDNELWLVKGVDKGYTYQKLGAIVERMNTILHKASGVLSGGAVIGCVMDTRVQYSEISNGVVYKHLGMNYRIFTQ